MSGRAPTRPRAVKSLAIDAVDDPATSRALDSVADAVRVLQAQRERDLKVVNLLIGTNKISHGLGRAVVGYTITPTFVTCAFGHAINATNPRPELEVWIDVVGSDQLKAPLEIF